MSVENAFVNFAEGFLYQVALAQSHRAGSCPLFMRDSCRELARPHSAEKPAALQNSA